MTSGGELQDRAVRRLVDGGTLSAAGWERARQASLGSGERLSDVVVKLGFASEDAMADALAAELGFPRASVEQLKPFVPEAVNIGFLAEARVVPALDGGGSTVLVVVDPFDEYPMQYMQRRLGQLVHLVGTAREVERLLALTQSTAKEVLGFGEAVTSLDVAALAEFSADAPVIRYLSGLIESAVDRGASDIHLSIQAAQPRARLRRDGVLVEADPPSAHQFPAIVARVKILANLDISEQRRPQDGRFRTVVGGREIDIRVSILPLLEGESAVLRILDRSRSPSGIGALLLEDKVEQCIRQLLQHTSGMILVTGPTGSGKTTTIAAMLAEVVGPERHVISVEDPVEIRIPGVTQIQIAPAIGLTFPTVLRSVLRHDPDIITIGEIRDKETANIAVHAALTGHLVLATLHTNSAAGAIARLQDMGIESFLLAATVKGLVAQRLIRRRCVACDGAASCPRCGGSGFQGRFPLVETISLDANLAGLISRGADERAIESEARLSGFRPLIEIGRDYIARGLTSEVELLRVVGAEP